MRMRGKKPIFSYRDTWNMDNTLSILIHSGLLRFKEVMKNPEHSDWFGYPHCDEIDNPEKWEKIINKMIFAFDPKNEPDMKDYNFSLEMIRGEPDSQSKIQTVPIEIKVTGEEEHQRYRDDVKTWENKCEEGRNFFAKYFHALWW